MTKITIEVDGSEMLVRPAAAPPSTFPEAASSMAIVGNVPPSLAAKAVATGAFNAGPAPSLSGFESAPIATSAGGSPTLAQEAVSAGPAPEHLLRAKE